MNAAVTELQALLEAKRKTLEDDNKNVHHHFTKADEYAAKVIKGKREVADIEAALRQLGAEPK